MTFDEAMLGAIKLTRRLARGQGDIPRVVFSEVADASAPKRLQARAIRAEAWGAVLHGTGYGETALQALVALEAELLRGLIVVHHNDGEVLRELGALQDAPENQGEST